MVNYHMCASNAVATTPATLSYTAAMSHVAADGADITDATNATAEACGTCGLHTFGGQMWRMQSVNRCLHGGTHISHAACAQVEATTARSPLSILNMNMSISISGSMAMPEWTLAAMAAMAVPVCDAITTRRTRFHLGWIQNGHIH